MDALQFAGGIVAQRTANARHLQTMRKAVVNKNASGQREHLGLVLQAAEGRRENQAVVIALKFGAMFFHIMMLNLSAGALRRNEAQPVHTAS